MSYVKTNIDLFAPKYREIEDTEIASMTQEQFDELPLCDQIHIFNAHRTEYDRLTGKTSDATTTQDAPEPTPEDRAKAFADAFEKRVDDAIRRAFHPNEG